jgi:DNA-binding response OmpR family regulator
LTDETAPGHILLVEDDGDIRELLCRQLARMGYAVTQAATAGECLSRLRSEGGSRLDLVLLDLHLPDSNGREVIENMRADPRILRLPVVILSCDRSAESVAELLASGAVDYLVKPWQERELEARMASAIRESRQKETLVRAQQVLARVKNELQLIFDAVSEAVMLVAPDMTIRRINRAGLAMSGRASYDELLGH